MGVGIILEKVVAAVKLYKHSKGYLFCQYGAKRFETSGVFEPFLTNFCAIIFIVLMSTIFQVKAST